MQLVDGSEDGLEQNSFSNTTHDNNTYENEENLTAELSNLYIPSQPQTYYREEQQLNDFNTQINKVRRRNYTFKVSQKEKMISSHGMTSNQETTAIVFND